MGRRRWIVNVVHGVVIIQPGAARQQGHGHEAIERFPQPGFFLFHHPSPFLDPPLFTARLVVAAKINVKRVSESNRRPTRHRFATDSV
jgi:hypothetical protein